MRINQHKSWNFAQKGNIKSIKLSGIFVTRMMNVGSQGNSVGIDASTMAMQTDNGILLNPVDIKDDKHTRSVFVGNIPYEASEEELRALFSETGPVLSFRLVYDRETNKPKGYGFCEYRDVETVQSTIRNLNGVELYGRILRVDSAACEKGRDDTKVYEVPIELMNAGAEIPSEHAPDAIIKVVSSLNSEQMFDLMKQMKVCMLNNPDECRDMLLQNPQLAYALLQALLLMKVIDPRIAESILTKENHSSSIPANSYVPLSHEMAIDSANKKMGLSGNIPTGTSIAMPSLQHVYMNQIMSSNDPNPVKINSHDNIHSTNGPLSGMLGHPSQMNPMSMGPSMISPVQVQMSMESEKAHMGQAVPMDHLEKPPFQSSNFPHTMHPLSSDERWSVGRQEDFIYSSTGSVPLDQRGNYTLDNQAFQPRHQNVKSRHPMPRPPSGQMPPMNQPPVNNFHDVSTHSSNGPNLRHSEHHQHSAPFHPRSTNDSRMESLPNSQPLPSRHFSESSHRPPKHNFPIEPIAGYDEIYPEHQIPNMRHSPINDPRSHGDRNGGPPFGGHPPERMRESAAPYRSEYPPHHRSNTAPNSYHGEHQGKPYSRYPRRGK